ncbi:MAG: class I SAM-dependent methyltransferase [Planctomycetes bacterium]|nr:class I SAM-dependent methyltransferase [Planctomycetota bacterium]
MSPEYDSLAHAYQRSKSLPFRVYSEIPNHLEILGDLRGLDVLDLACGEGFYTRLIRHAGAARVVGVDVSPQMIALARHQEHEAASGIEYVVGAAESIHDLGTFDVVSTAFLLNCAADQSILNGMTQAISRSLVPGGRLVATLGDLGHQPGVDYSTYGMSTNVTAGLAEGAPYNITFLLDVDTFSITDFNHSQATYAAACQAAGLKVLGWHPCTVTDEGIRQYGTEYWYTWLSNPCLWRLEAQKI